MKLIKLDNKVLNFLINKNMNIAFNKKWKLNIIAINSE